MRHWRSTASWKETHVAERLPDGHGVPQVNGVPAPGDTSVASRPSLLYVATVTYTINQFLRPYAAHFRALGWRVEAACNGGPGDPVLVDAFDDVHDLPLSRSILNAAGMVRAERALSMLLEKRRPDIVHVHTPIAAFVARAAVRRAPPARRPLIAYTAHGFHFHRGGRAATNAAFLTAERVAGRWTDRLIVINDEDEEAARRHRIVPARRLVRMPGIGIDTQRFSRSALAQGAMTTARQAMVEEPGVPLFLAVGELNRNKRPEDAIAAVALMNHREAHLALVGHGSGQARLEALVRDRGLSDRVAFTGYVNDVRPLVAAATATILPSTREGLARSIMEALALEVPVIASTARGNQELVDHDSGFIVPTGDVAGYARSMDWLIEHPDERDAMGRHGRERMIAGYDVRILIRRHEELYRDMLAEAGHGS